MRKCTVVSICLCMAVVLAITGCGGGGGMSASQIQTAQVLFDEALASDKAGETAEAFTKVDAAIVQGGLNPDQLCEAYLLRSRCHSANGKLDEALADIEYAEQGSPNPSVWHFSRSVYFAAKGDATKSKSEFAIARRFNPTLKIPK